MAAEKAKEMAKSPVKVIKNPYDITEVKLEEEAPVTKTAELVPVKSNDTESDREDEEMVVANPPTVAVKAEFFSKQSDDLEAKIEAIKRQIAEQQES